MTIQVVFAQRNVLSDDWVDIDPITHTGSAVRAGDTTWVEVVRPELDWVNLDDILILGFDKDMVEGRYLYVGTHFRRAVCLNGYHAFYKGQKYYLIDKGDRKVNVNFQYTMVPAINLHKIDSWEFK